MKQETLQLTAGGKKENRRKLDFYPTPKNVTKALMEFLFKEKHLDFNTKIWEPACGSGHMSEILKQYCPNVYSSDLRQTEYGDGNIDFLEYSGKGEFDAIITNPPFSLAHQFIEKSIKETSIVAMLLKSQYWHAKSRLDLFTNTPPAYVLPLTWRPDFYEHERKKGEKKGAPTMEVAWSVWIKGSQDTKYFPLKKP